MGLLEALAEHVTWSSDRVGPLWPGISKGDVELKWMGKDEQEVVWRRAGQRKCLSFKAGKRHEVSTHWSTFLAANPSQSIVRSIPNDTGRGAIFYKS